MSNVLVVLIRFGDNDFYYTFTSVLRALRSWFAGARWEERFLDRTKLCRLINALAPLAYEYVQSHRGDEINPDTRAYIEVTESMLLLGKEEVDDFLANNMESANGEWFVLDTRLPEDQQVFHV